LHCFSNVKVLDPAYAGPQCVTPLRRLAILALLLLAVVLSLLVYAQNLTLVYNVTTAYVTNTATSYAYETTSTYVSTSPTSYTYSPSLTYISSSPEVYRYVPSLVYISATPDIRRYVLASVHVTSSPAEIPGVVPGLAAAQSLCYTPPLNISIEVVSVPQYVFPWRNNTIVVRIEGLAPYCAFAILRYINLCRVDYYNPLRRGTVLYTAEDIYCKAEAVEISDYNVTLEFTLFPRTWKLGPYVLANVTGLNLCYFDLFGVVQNYSTVFIRVNNRTAVVEAYAVPDRVLPGSIFRIYVRFVFYNTTVPAYMEGVLVNKTLRGYTNVNGTLVILMRAPVSLGVYRYVIEGLHSVNATTVTIIVSLLPPGVAPPGRALAALWWTLLLLLLLALAVLAVLWWARRKRELLMRTPIFTAIPAQA